MNRNKLSTLFICPVWMVLACGMLHAQNVVTDWTAIESTTIVKNAAIRPPPQGFTLPMRQSQAMTQSMRSIVDSARFTTSAEHGAGPPRKRLLLLLLIECL